MHLSVAVPAFNAGRTLAVCLAAIRRSTFSDYELIVVDDGSSDESRTIAAAYADAVIEHAQNRGLPAARNTAIQAARGELILFVDADVVAPPDALARVVEFFRHTPAAAAVTGRLAKEHPHPMFFSQYKNLYMHYIFGLLPPKVSFLYGSIHAVRKAALLPYAPLVEIGEDSERGQQLLMQGQAIYFLRDLEVVHLKRYGALSLLKNDFSVPYHWTKLFLAYRGWKQLGRSGTGYLHSPREQLISLVLLGLWWLGLLQSALSSPAPITLTALAGAWLAINARFLFFLLREKGARFCLAAAAFTWLDQTVMFAGLVCGVLRHLPMLRNQKVTQG